ncbi:MULTISPECIES: NADP-dependent oxidoreductase [unclassified Streptomyces]|uniref:NADP-dependent oxidoreductase n=2 Tax=unclassified Streptomyces TaxID=2593676 RepID=UPI0001C1B087|nr:Alcohol dehydrogenase zinc-binding domain protein [Streptomyces sp. SirexAA-E]MYR67848.1 zinc-binding dehydrogenase [Streptomyces sp. SID4939]MYS00321.1 zinc-binding dehydrogenase [Streptomyces sp. SID4940]MYT67809.1 zinc-binding dehydrogenase [Streptomyces sp. SID8357]MYT86653.1 zinc-binding dehydrogenase [Streptomyces sp. SID8360]MYW41369.1 zinc-binding dehydrogenase [Streptomyces sp. SID1]PZX37550.1 NADPH:quinone reductase-like Zn-dependent oxidoreductase [Streptomyces sp. DvalAA-21]RA
MTPTHTSETPHSPDPAAATQPPASAAPHSAPVMLALHQTDLGGPEVLRLTELPRPAPGPGQILVAVHAAGLNPTDFKHRAQKVFLPPPPMTLGWDVSGTVVETGYGVTLFRPGDEVFGMLPYPYGAGSHAEYVTGPTRAFVAKPAGIDHVQAAALPLAALTAWQALVETADLRAGQRVLIHAAAGGVGHLAVQIAKERGAHVTGTASAPKHDFLRELGADACVDHRSEDFAGTEERYDVVLDSLGGETATRSVGVLRPGGVLVSLLPGAEDTEAAAERARVRAVTLLVEHDQAGMRAVADLVDRGKLLAHVSGTFPLAEGARAHAQGETGRTTGKLVITVR